MNYETKSFKVIKTFGYNGTSMVETVTRRGKWGTTRAHRHARTLPNPEAIGPEIEEGEVNQRPLQAFFPLLWGGAGSAAGPGAILLQRQTL